MLKVLEMLNGLSERSREPLLASWHKEKGACNETDGMHAQNQYETVVFLHSAVSSGIHWLGNLLKPEAQYDYKSIRRLVWVKKVLWAFIVNKVLEVFSKLPGAPDGKAGGRQLGKNRALPSQTVPGKGRAGAWLGMEMLGDLGRAVGSSASRGLQKWVSSAAAQAGGRQLVWCAAGSNAAPSASPVPARLLPADCGRGGMLLQAPAPL